MPNVHAQPTLVEQVVNAIVSEIVDGELPSNSRLIQDELARAYGVSRQPVQQALLLLRDRGLVREASGRGLIVSPIDPDFVRKLYGPCWTGLPPASRPNAVPSGPRSRDRLTWMQAAPPSRAVH
jgi:DNA-binding FadR family transcriptional regulator